MDFSFSFLKGKKIEEVDEIVEVFLKEVLHKFIFSEIIDIINEHKAKDREVIIVSNGADILVKKVADFLDIKNYISTRLEITNGKFTGKILGDIVYGKNKVKVTNEFIKKNNLDLYNSYAYADHISDLDLLLMVSNPFAVNPDNLLFAEAKKRNWPILMFNKNLINK
jgi:HAD superfamily hydrolase (TIGR01490 family)